jgi:hypothetical protein
VQSEGENGFRKIMAPDKVSVSSMEIGLEVRIPGSSVCSGLVIGGQNTNATKRNPHIKNVWQHRWEVEVICLKKSEQINLRYCLLAPNPELFSSARFLSTN